MLRTIGAVVIGYVVLVLFVFVTFSLTYLLLGADGAFEPGSYNVSTLWLIISFVVGLLAAVLGGYVCASIARNARAPIILAGIVLVLGLLLAIPVVMTPSEGGLQVREGNVGIFEAMQNAKQPAWVALVNPIVGAIGIMIGARLKGDSKS
jgi:hypothetical protein